MVQVGIFNVTLVEAKSKKAFKEHTALDGRTFVEVEPDKEYFIQIEIMAGEADTTHKVNFKVDEKDLGYSTNLTRAYGPIFEGIWSFDAETEVSRTNALQFQKPKLTKKGTKNDSIGLLGTVQVMFSQAICEGFQDHDDVFVAHFEATATVPRRSETQKLLRSGTGSHSEVVEEITIARNYSTGELLETVILHYGSTASLVQAGVFAPPRVHTASTTNPNKNGGVGGPFDSIDSSQRRGRRRGRDTNTNVDALEDAFTSLALGDTNKQDTPKKRSKSKSRVTVMTLPPQRREVIEILSSSDEESVDT